MKTIYKTREQFMDTTLSKVLIHFQPKTGQNSLSIVWSSDEILEVRNVF